MKRNTLTVVQTWLVLFIACCWRNCDGDAKVAATKDRSHNDLLLTLAQVMGTPPSTGKFGEPTYCTGPITQILNP